jgi:hypothetical protein
MLKKIFPLMFILLACVACEKSIDTYEGASGIYFEHRSITNLYLDTLSIHWGTLNSDITDQKIKLKVCLFGNTTDYDRKFNIEVGALPDDEYAATENVDYKKVDPICVMPANQSEAYIEIDLLRAPDLLSTSKRFAVRLVETDELQFLYSRIQSSVLDDGSVEKRNLDYQRIIVMDEIFSKPNWWAARSGDYIFGSWSATKCALICDVMNIDRNDWLDASLMQPGYLKFVGKYMYRWLQENPQVDEDGKAMTMGTGSMI